MSRIVVTGCAGFIGSNLSVRLLEEGHQVVGIDTLSPEGDSFARKAESIARLRRYGGFHFLKKDVKDLTDMENALREYRDLDQVVHLSAKGGVRGSIEEPVRYEEENVVGTVSVLELCRRLGIPEMVYASSSSVYGGNCRVPFREEDRGLSPASPYGLTKLQGEQYCELYHRLHHLNVTILRLFTVYGPGQRPDMAFFRFLSAAISGGTVKVHGGGSTYRDYTYIGDVVDGIVRALGRVAGCRVYNLGSGRAFTLDQVLSVITGLCGREIAREEVPLAKGEVAGTLADISRARAELGYSPETSLKEGLERQMEWMRRLIEV